ncbi:MAG: PAS domain-containing protein [Myxococcales bacterium]|nr:PAS domain-containing protein [Myxococcales bacterium]
MPKKVRPDWGVTLRTKLEQVQTLQLFDTLLGSAPQGFVFLDRDLRFVLINERLAEMNGLSVAAHLGKTVGEILPTLEADLRMVTEGILATGQPVLDHEFTGETPRAPGVTRTWSESWYPVPDERGEIIGFGAVVVDVTERKQAEAALRLSNDRFELAVKASKAVLWQQDLQLRFTWLHNPAAGIDDADPLGKRDADLLERAADAAVIDGFKREVMRTGVGMRREFFPQIQGVVRSFEVLMEPLRDASGHITGHTGAAIDITERKNAEAAQRDTDRNYRALADASSEIPYRMSADWSTMLPLDGRGVFANSNRPLADWAWLDQYLPQDEHARVRQLVSDAIARKSLFEMEHRVLRSDGATVWVRSRAVPILGEHGALVEWFGVATDITERKAAELKLRRTTERLELSVKASRVVLFQQDLELRYLWIENASPGFEGAEIIGKRDVDLMERAEEAARIEAVKLDVIRSGVGTRQEVVIHTRNEARYFDLLVEPLLDGAGLTSGVTCAAIDITERKQTELKLIEAKAVAEKASRAKSEFLSNMSHELRTPLHAILGFAQLMELVAPAPTPTQAKNLAQIVKGGWYLLGLINELLDLAQIESGQLPLTLAPISLAEVMLECQALIEPQADKRGIGVTFPAFALSGAAYADRTRVKQVMLNLLSNAIKYNKAEGALTVEYALRGPDAIRVSIHDTGEGLAPEKLAQLFQPFNRLGREGGREEGTGIGLVMSKRLVELMGGSIGAESTVGVGSVFWFDLKWAAAAPATAVV